MAGFGMGASSLVLELALWEAMPWLLVRETLGASGGKGLLQGAKRRTDSGGSWPERFIKADARLATWSVRNVLAQADSGTVMVPNTTPQPPRIPKVCAQLGLPFRAVPRVMVRKTFPLPSTAL